MGIPSNVKVNKIGLKLIPRKTYSIAIGRVNKKDDIKSISTFSTEDGKRVVKWMNKTILAKCVKQKHPQEELRFNFDYPESNIWYSFDDIEGELAATDAGYIEM